MLELKKIVKNYELGKRKDKDFQIVNALKGVDLKFRKNEFVSILGPSGCGKTTLLNIIGGLDKYTDGDLIINGISTKQYKDRDWDTYRNHSIGFVFQSYNLIPHQTVLQNVELALTLSGVSKTERREKAKQVLTKVGLSDKLNSKPNQLSGGQMQRVAIARALVNDPEIILADEPTGALDSKTSVQIMEILKKISNDKLIIMVTHNPELAKTYSSRIINLFDGEIISDSNPISDTNDNLDNSTMDIISNDINLVNENNSIELENNINGDINSKITNSKRNKQKNKKTTMSFFTALSLSLNNLLTKKTRTFLVSFAGSIGIIGIALILSLSNGFQLYIDNVQRDTLSSYPITVNSTGHDFTSLITDYMGESEVQHELDKIYVNRIFGKFQQSMQNNVIKNDLKSFKSYIENESNIKDYVNAIKYTYDLDLDVYYDNGVQISHADTSNSMMEQSMISSSIFEEMLDNPELITTQYELLKGVFPDIDEQKNEFKDSSKNQILLVTDEKNEINDLTLYSLGIFSYTDLSNTEQKSYTYDEILNMDFFVVLNDAFYKKNNETGVYYDELDLLYKTKGKVEAKSFIDNLSAEEREKYILELDIVGIIKPNEDVSNHSITGNIAYTSRLTEYVIDKVYNRAINDTNNIAYKQLNNKTINLLENKPFGTGVNDESFSSKTYENVLSKIGYIDKNSPTTISFYASNFEGNDRITEIINEYNNKMLNDPLKGEDYAITYIDYIGIMMSSISTIINAISYVLIAFVSVSLVVSSIMIGIIIYISVLERIKEIGVLRSIGASKKDIKRVFTAESLIIGLTAGLVGIIISVLLLFPINAIIYALATLKNVAKLPVLGAIILVAISMGLTFIAGLIPANIASKKDPVIALRTE